MISHGSKVKKFRVHLSKKDAYFLYFILESLEGLCFYSTEETPEDLKLKGMRAISINYLEENTQVFKVYFIPGIPKYDKFLPYGSQLVIDTHLFKIEI